MAFVLADRVFETSTTTGTGTISLAGAVTGAQSFVAGVGDGNTTFYVIEDGTDWEVGVGTVTSGSPDTLSRDTVLQSSNSDAAVNWGAGTRNVFVSLPADKTPVLDQANTFSAANTYTGANDFTGGTIAVPTPALDAQAATKAYVDTGLTNFLDTAHEYTKTQNFNATTLTDAATIAWDLESNQVASVTLGGNRTLGAPTNMVDGATYILIVKQDATGGRTLAYNTAYKFPGGTAPTLSTGVNAVDILTFISDGTSMFGVFQGDFS